MHGVWAEANAGTYNRTQADVPESGSFLRFFLPSGQDPYFGLPECGSVSPGAEPDCAGRYGMIRDLIHELAVYVRRQRCSPNGNLHVILRPVLQRIVYDAQLAAIFLADLHGLSSHQEREHVLLSLVIR